MTIAIDFEAYYDSHISGRWIDKKQVTESLLVALEISDGWSLH
jgi:hypothetical protein